MGSQSTGAGQADEAALILRCQTGDAGAFQPIVVRYMRYAAGFALAWTGSRDDALDLSQEAFARAYRAIARFDAARPFYPWFHRILRNLCINHLARARRLGEVPLEEAREKEDERPGPAAALESAETRRLVWEALRRLNAPDREILILREFQGLTYAEMAEVLGIPRGTVMSRLHQARLRLRAGLAPRIPAAAEKGESR
ncbi:MAG: sigma-70 family RNA polymerase sigma factor [Candidatus Eisenbacteria bacterium]